MAKKHYHLVGIKGVGMTALAGILIGKGALVTGSDLEESFVTDSALKDLKVDVANGFNQSNISGELEAVIYSGAYSKDDNPELLRALEIGIPIHTQQEMLNLLVKDKKVIAVAGVGGKTTISAMLASILTSTGRDIGYFVGAGVIDGNKLPGKWGEDEYFVIEADEYANSVGTDNTPKLLLLNPQIAVIPNLRFDHPDIYKNEQDTVETFRAFLEKIPSNGTIYINSEDKMTKEVLGVADIKANIIRIGVDSGDWLISTKSISSTTLKGILSDSSTSREINLNLVGVYNLFNAAISAVVASDLGSDWSQILSALANFRGVGRRQQFMGEVEGILLYDDYAHHPHEVMATIKSFKEQFPDRRLWVLFESHTYTRTQVLLEDFINSLEEADVVSIMPIFSSAREDKSSFDLSEESIAAELNSRGTPANSMSFEEASSYIAKNARSKDIILTMGAGKVYELHGKIAQALEEEASRS